MIKRQSGFTLIEMLVIAPIVILAIGAFIVAVVSLTGEVLSSRASNVLTFSVQDAFNRIEQDVKLSNNFVAENSFNVTAAQGSGDNTTKFVNVGGPNGNTLILNMIAISGNPASSTSNIVYLANQPNACTSPTYVNNNPLTIDVVYFIKNDANGNSSLWRRTIMPSNYDTQSARCSTLWERPSCSPGYNPATYPFCKTNDIKLVEGVPTTGFTINYYTDSSSTSPNTVAVDTGQSVANRNAAFLTLNSVEVTISASQTVAGRQATHSATLRVTRL